jgi:predicted nucleic acid-binding protein
LRTIGFRDTTAQWHHRLATVRSRPEFCVTIRKTAALIIGTFCIEYGHRLLHADRDFEPM